MRSSKSRQRSKQNRPRSLGNIINRVFDSSGPEGKVRGTPAQLIEKYQFLARDAQLSNDRVAAENFLQHAEHYTRLLAEANREMAAEQEARQQFQAQNNNGQNRDQRREERGEYRPDYRAEAGGDDQPVIAGHDMVDVLGDEDGGLVETPEAGPRPPRQDDNRRQDRPRFDRPRDDQRRGYPPRVDQSQQDRPETGERPERQDRGDRSFRNDRGERFDRGPRPDQTEVTAPGVTPAAPQPRAEAPATPAEAPKPAKPRSRAPRKPATEAPTGE